MQTEFPENEKFPRSLKISVQAYRLITAGVASHNNYITI